jgi:hypothetical protein
VAANAIHRLRRIVWPPIPPESDHLGRARAYSRRAVTAAGVAVAWAVVSLAFTIVAAGH